MLEKAIRYIAEELSKPNIHEIKGQTYSDKFLNRVSHNPKATPIQLNTLTSLVDYIKSNVDSMGHMFIHVASPTSVEFFSALDEERTREHIINVVAKTPGFKFNQFIDHETFCINLQSKFLNSEDRALVLKFAGTVETGSLAEYGDDGVTQKASVKTGIASKTDAIVPNPVELTAFRTFLEVEQPSSKFVFRMKQDKYDGIQCALFEADGGEWEIVAMQRIKAFLEEALKDIQGVTVIS